VRVGADLSSYQSRKILKRTSKTDLGRVERDCLSGHGGGRKEAATRGCLEQGGVNGLKNAQVTLVELYMYSS
jgi:hypothetical protein